MNDWSQLHRNLVALVEGVGLAFFLGGLVAWVHFGLRDAKGISLRGLFRWKAVKLAVLIWGVGALLVLYEAHKLGVASL